MELPFTLYRLCSFSVAGLGRFCKPKNATAPLAEVLKVSPRNAEAEAQLSRLAFEAGNEEEVLSLVAKALTYDPTDVLANEYRAKPQLRSGQLRGAGQTLERLVQLDPQSSRFRLLLESVISSRENSAEAEREFQLLNDLALKRSPEKR